MPVEDCAHLTISLILSRSSSFATTLVNACLGLFVVCLTCVSLLRISILYLSVVGPPWPSRPLIRSVAFLTAIFIQSLLPCLPVAPSMYVSVSLPPPLACHLHVFMHSLSRCADVLEISKDVLKQAYEMQVYDYTRFLKSTRLFRNMSEVQVVLTKTWKNMYELRAMDAVRSVFDL